MKTSILSSLLCLGSLVLMTGCGNNSDGGNQQGATNGGQGNASPWEPGCTSNPSCGSCQTCYEACVCQTGQNQGCVGQCAGQGMVTPIGGGSGGSANNGSGGSGNVNQGGSGNVNNQGGSGNVNNQGGSGNVGTGTGGSVQGAGGDGNNPPPPDWQEVTITSDTFPVAAGDEIYRAQSFPNPIGHDVDVIESESFMTPGSHHMFAFHNTSYNSGSPLQTSTGIEFDAYIHTAQTPQQIVTYPAGIGRFLPGNHGIRLQVHYINTGTTSLNASVSLRIRYVDPSKVQYHAAEVFLNNVGINVPPGKSTASSTVAMPYAIKLLGAASHMHKRAVLFDSKTNDGREIYTTTQWDEPAANSFDPGMDIPAGGSITWACTWQNDTGQTLKFGESAATNEMCIFSGVYYPAPGGAGISRQCLSPGVCL